jgi:hypothetical protein
MVGHVRCSYQRVWQEPVVVLTTPGGFAFSGRNIVPAAAMRSKRKSRDMLQQRRSKAAEMLAF